MSKILMKTKICFFVLVVSSLLLIGCNTGAPTKPQQPRRTTTPSSPSETVDTNDYTLKGAIEYCKTGQFRYTFAFKRTDAQPLTSDDKTFIKASSPIEVSYWLKTNDGIYAVACSNFPFKQEHLDAIQTRFKIEDHSETK